MINSFSGPYRFLSNFYPSRIVMDGITYPTVEHAYQAAKTLDLQGRATIHQSNSPSQAKTRGTWVKLRPDWEQIKLKVMKDLVRQKFYSSVSLMERLLQTGDEELVEGNTWGDRFWGVYEGDGENHLGKILMEVREEIRSS